jgi:DNA repair exonuclease SbcCD ATPase subunit
MSNTPREKPHDDTMRAMQIRAEIAERERNEKDKQLVSCYAYWDKTLEELVEARVESAALRALLAEAAIDIKDWGAYAGEYFKKKWDLEGCVKKYLDAAKKP